MSIKLKHNLLKTIPLIFTDIIGELISKLFSKKLINELIGKATDFFLELLLKGMSLAFCLSKGYRKNIKNFKGRYLFKTADNHVVVAATFDNGNMDVHRDAIENWDVAITFKDTTAFKDFIFSRNQDILDSLLKNEVEVDGNINYIYKLGFMVRDLAHRLGAA